MLKTTTTYCVAWFSLGHGRYPMIDGDLVPLAVLARELGVTCRCLVKAATLWSSTPPKSARVATAEAVMLSPVIGAADLGPVLLLARPRRTSPRLAQLRRSAVAMSFKHHAFAPRSPDWLLAQAASLQYAIEIERQRCTDLRRQLAMPGGAARTLIGRRWGSALDEPMMLGIVDMARRGEQIERIAFETGKNPVTIRQFLDGKYASAAARAFYLTHGAPSALINARP